MMPRAHLCPKLLWRQRQEDLFFCVLAGFVNLTQVRLGCEEGTSVEKKSLSDCGQAWGIFS